MKINDEFIERVKVAVAEIEENQDKYPILSLGFFEVYVDGKESHFRHKTRGIYLKPSVRVSRKFASEYKLPTIIILECDGVNEWVIQPVADVSDKAQTTAYHFFNDLDFSIPDFKSYNLCLYKGEPRILDW